MSIKIQVAPDNVDKALRFTAKGFHDACLNMHNKTYIELIVKLTTWSPYMLTCRGMRQKHLLIFEKMVVTKGIGFSTQVFRHSNYYCK